MNRDEFTITEILRLREFGESVDPDLEPDLLVSWCRTQGYSLLGMDWIATPVKYGPGLGRFGLPWLLHSADPEWPAWDLLGNETPEGYPPYGWHGITGTDSEIAHMIYRAGSILNGGFSTLRVLRNDPEVNL